jgi:hypothetical protein
VAGSSTATPIIAPPNRIDRATRRALRDKERKERAVGARDAEAAVAALEARLEQLTRLHCVAYARKDWNEAARQTLVEPSVKPHAKEQAARRALANYVPGIIDSLFGLEADKRRRLNERVLEAAREDAVLYAKAKKAADDHNLDINLAPGVLAMDPESIETALRAHLPVAELAPAVEGLLFACPAPGKLTVYLELLELDALPDEVCTPGPAGEIVFGPMPASQRYELQLLNACSAALRVAVETLAQVPVDAVEILARCHLFNPATRELEPYPVLYLKAPHEALARMDLRRLEPVSTVTALGGRVDWELGRGLAPIQVDDLGLALPAGTVKAKAAA